MNAFMKLSGELAEALSGVSERLSGRLKKAGSGWRVEVLWK